MGGLEGGLLPFRKLGEELVDRQNLVRLRGRIEDPNGFLRRSLNRIAVGILLQTTIDHAGERVPLANLAQTGLSLGLRSLLILEVGRELIAGHSQLLTVSDDLLLDLLNIFCVRRHKKPPFENMRINQLD